MNDTPGSNQPAPTAHTDVMVLGAGSGGERLATLLAGRGVEVTVVEERLVGGECPFFACIPSKAMVISAEVRSTLSIAHQVGAVGAPIDLDDGRQAFSIAAARRDALAEHHDDSDHAADLTDSGVNLVRGRGRVQAPGRLAVSRDGSEQVITFDRLVIATGSAPVIPDIPGLTDVDAWTFEDAWTARERPGSMLVLGGGAVGCEIAQVYARFGCAVTLVDRGELGSDRMEPEIAADLADALAADGVVVRTGAEVAAVSTGADGMVHAHLSGDSSPPGPDGDVLTVERLVLATGMAPRLDGLGLDALGISDTEELAVGSDGRVAGRDDLWALGDVTGLAPFTHTANRQADVMADNLCGGTRVVDERAIPRTIYTRPEVAGVGHTRESAEAAGLHTTAAVFSLADTARAHVDHLRAGRVVLLADVDTGTLIGASLMAPSAGESIGELALAIQHHVTVHALTDLIHPFPTWAEGLGPAIAKLAEQLPA